MAFHYGRHLLECWMYKHFIGYRKHNPNSWV